MFQFWKKYARPSWEKSGLNSAKVSSRKSPQILLYSTDETGLPPTPVNNTVTIFCQRADTTSLISLPLMSSRGEFNWIQAIAKIIEGQALNVHSQSLNVKKTSKLSANTQTVEQDIFLRERKKFPNLVHLTRGGQGLWREEWESLTQSSCRERLHVTGCSWLCLRPEKNTISELFFNHETLWKELQEHYCKTPFRRIIKWNSHKLPLPL